MKYCNGKFHFMPYQVKIDVFDALYYVAMPNLIFLGVAIIGRNTVQITEK